MTPCIVIEIYHCFGGISYFHLLGSRRRHVGKLCIRYRGGKKAVWVTHWEISKQEGMGPEKSKKLVILVLTTENKCHNGSVVLSKTSLIFSLLKNSQNTNKLLQILNSVAGAVFCEIHI
jgi:hypothetical protein